MGTSISADSGDTEAIVWTEGKTDWKHLKKALEKLRLDLRVSFHETDEKDLGSDVLLKKWRTFA